MQLRFAPPQKRKKQLENAELFLHTLDKNTEYPFEFVYFRITGFPPKTIATPAPIKADELAQDLLGFIERLSNQLTEPAWTQHQKVYTADQLAEIVGVSTKTIQRWRTRGLVARKFIFKDGFKRFGFLQTSVDSFFDANRSLITKASTFGRMTNAEKQQIITRAATLGATTNLSPYQIIEHLAAEFGKVHETIRYTLADYEKTNPHQPLFKNARGVLGSAKAAELYQLFKQGVSVKELTVRFGRNKSSIYRIINQKRAKLLLAKKIRFIESDDFLQPDADEKILAGDLSEPMLVEIDSRRPFVPATGTLTKYLQTLKAIPLLTRDREMRLFRRYNYLKFLAGNAVSKINLTHISGGLLNNIEKYLAQAEIIKKIIIEANLRLVVSIAGKHTSRPSSLLDLVSEGNFSLMRAVESFDYRRGFRFGTYASWAITKHFARKIPADATHQDKYTAAASMSEIHRDLRATGSADVLVIERANRGLLEVIANELNQREQYIIINHFGLVGSLIKKEKKSLKQIGQGLDISKERVRQVELGALQKLRQVLSIEEFELLIG